MRAGEETGIHMLVLFSIKEIVNLYFASSCASIIPFTEYFSIIFLPGKS